MADFSLVPGLAGDRIDSVGGVSERIVRPGVGTRAEPGPVERPSDRVDISDRARFLSKLSELPETRVDLIERIRDQIARGAYETEDRLNQAIRHLAEDLEVES